MHRLLFVEEVKSNLLDVMEGFLKSTEGSGVYLRNADQDATQGQTGFELRAEGVPVVNSDYDPNSFRQSTFSLCTNIYAEGRFKVDATEFYKETGETKANKWEYMGNFDPFREEQSATASNILLHYHQMVDDDYISAKIVEYVWPLIGREPFRGTYSSVKEMKFEPQI